MIALKVLATFCLATFCLASPATLTGNEKKNEILKDTISKLFETIPEMGAKLVKETLFGNPNLPKIKANVNASLSGARLAGSASFDFQSVIDKLSVGEPQDFNVDLIVKIEDFTIKVIQN